MTKVTLSMVLTNKSENYYSPKYKLSLGFKDIQKVKASDPDGIIVPDVVKTDDGYDIELNFNKKVIGLGNKLNFNLSFETDDVLQKNGEILELTIPGVADSITFSTFSVQVRVPVSFGNPSYIRSQYGKVVDRKTGSLYSFTKNELGQGGISMAFGNKQAYSFNLTYHLKNKNLFPVRTEIALPPSTNYQDVFIKDINPKPVNVHIDKDGNWLATYNLMPSQKIDVKVSGSANINLFPKKEYLTKEQINEYTKEKPNWQRNDEIKKLAEELKTAPRIYDYVVNKLEYDYTRAILSKPRLGAQGALSSPSSAVCLEFTDLFIAIARAAGIPSREVDGFAFTQNSKLRPLSLVKDVLHAWPEYYDKDKSSWIMIDPTWGNTTNGMDYFNLLDFNHFAFAVKGYESDYPIPAGGYKIDGKDYKDVDAKPQRLEGETPQKFELSLDLPENLPSGLPISGNIIIKNVGNSVLEEQKVQLTSYALSTPNNYYTIAKTPPFGYTKTPFNFDKTPFLTNKTESITIAIGGKRISQTVEISPLYLINKKTGGILIAGIASSVAIIFIIIRKRLR